LVDNTIEHCKDIPTQIATTGKISLTRKEINMQIGELFILRINIHLNGSVLDTPELFWVEPQLEPVYSAVRAYLEMDQRVTLLTERLAVIKDLLQVLKDQLSHGHGEMLEWIGESVKLIRGENANAASHCTHCYGDPRSSHKYCGGLVRWGRLGLHETEHGVEWVLENKLYIWAVGLPKSETWFHCSRRMHGLQHTMYEYRIDSCPDV
jgi:hypothetical protein